MVQSFCQGLLLGVVFAQFFFCVDRDLRQESVEKRWAGLFGTFLAIGSLCLVFHGARAFSRLF